jgi:transcriptional regulator with XRE-family HTH domain
MSKWPIRFGSPVPENSIGAKIKRARVARNWTQKKLAQEAGKYLNPVGLSPKFLSTLENNRNPLTREVKQALEKALGTKL